MHSELRVLLSLIHGVIPAKAGISVDRMMGVAAVGTSRATPGPNPPPCLGMQPTEIPAFAGMTPWMGSPCQLVAAC